MQEKIKISAVIPTYNREKTITRAIDSVLAQDYLPIEIIVIDDGSEDNTRKVIEKYGKRIRYVYQANRGVSVARNCGVSEANGEWIAFLDSDDYWLAHHLGNMVSAIEGTNGHASLYFSDTMPSQEFGEPTHWKLCKFQIPGPFLLKKDASEWAFLRIQPMMLQSSVIRKKTYWEVGGLPENLLTREDTYLFFILALYYPICAVSGCGAIMKSDGNQRLTSMYDGGNIVYLQSTILLYKLLLTCKKRMPYKYRRLLNHGLSNSYIGLGRFYWRHNDFIMTLRSLLISAWISPTQFVRQVIEKHIYGSRKPNRKLGMTSDRKTSEIEE